MGVLNFRLTVPYSYRSVVKVGTVEFRRENTYPCTPGCFSLFPRAISDGSLRQTEESFYANKTKTVKRKKMHSKLYTDTALWRVLEMQKDVLSVSDMSCCRTLKRKAPHEYLLARAAYVKEARRKFP